jgi:hypothetical protein
MNEKHNYRPFIRALVEVMDENYWKYQFGMLEKAVKSSSRVYYEESDDTDLLVRAGLIEFHPIRHCVEGPYPFSATKKGRELYDEIVSGEKRRKDVLTDWLVDCAFRAVEKKREDER